MISKELPYTEQLARRIALCGQELVNRSQEIAGSIGRITDFEITINFPSNRELDTITVTKTFIPDELYQELWKGVSENDQT